MWRCTVCAAVLPHTVLAYSKCHNLPRRMPEMKDLNKVRVFLDAVVNQNRSVDQLAYTRTIYYRAANIGEGLQQIDVV